MKSDLKEKYRSQKNGAKSRGINWHFTFESWIDWWGTDIINRGNKKGQLVMARNGDTGPYHPNNVRKATFEENTSEGNLGKPLSEAHKQKISKTSKGKLKGSMTDEHKKNISKSLSGRTKPRFNCVICGNSFTLLNLNRWHNDNCKLLR